MPEKQRERNKIESLVWRKTGRLVCECHLDQIYSINAAQLEKRKKEKEKEREQEFITGRVACMNEWLGMKDGLNFCVSCVKMQLGKCIQVIQGVTVCLVRREKERECK